MLFFIYLSSIPNRKWNRSSFTGGEVLLFDRKLFGVTPLIYFLAGDYIWGLLKRKSFHRLGLKKGPRVKSPRACGGRFMK
jgi:hypothetical protein